MVIPPSGKSITVDSTNVNTYQPLEVQRLSLFFLAAISAVQGCYRQSYFTRPPTGRPNAPFFLCRHTYTATSATLKMTTPITVWWEYAFGKMNEARCFCGESGGAKVEKICFSLREWTSGGLDTSSFAIFKYQI